MSRDDDWSEFLDRVKAGSSIINLLPSDSDSALVGQAHKFLMSTLSHGYIVAMLADVDFPHFEPIYHWPYPIGANPDATYYHAPVDPAGSYRLWGKRNSIFLVNLQLCGEYFGIENGTYAALANLDFRDLDVAEDGTFELLLSAERPRDHAGDWFALTKDTRYLLIRQFAYDWLTEAEANIRIERVDRRRDYPKRRSGAQITALMKRAAEIDVEVARTWGSLVASYRRAGSVNELVGEGFVAQGGWSSQLYYHGWFEMGEDEGLILETKVPAACRYWNVQLTDDLCVPVDYVNRQSHLNGFRARVDDDGVFRAVISMKDPGLANWLDSGGNRTGSILGRWNEAIAPPIPTLTKIPFANLPDFLPAATPRVTKSERAKMLNALRNAFLFRVHR
jgi:hypothetical protein